MKASNILKPKSKEEIDTLMKSFTDYRIKYVDNEKRILQYKKKVKFLIFSWYIWRDVYSYDLSLNKKKLYKYKKTAFEDSLLINWAKKYPIYEKFINENYNEKKALLKGKKPRYKYLDKNNFKELNSNNNEINDILF